MSINLKVLRRKKGFTQKEIAEIIGISKSYYAMLETYKRKPSIKLAKKISNILSFSWEDFFIEEYTNKFFDFKTRRKEKDLTVDEVCLLTNINRKDYLAIENGQKEPNDDELRVLKMIFDL